MRRRAPIGHPCWLQSREDVPSRTKALVRVHHLLPSVEAGPYSFSSWSDESERPFFRGEVSPATAENFFRVSLWQAPLHFFRLLHDKYPDVLSPLGLEETRDSSRILCAFHIEWIIFVQVNLSLLSSPLSHTKSVMRATISVSAHAAVEYKGKVVPAP
jgi:hypothetical protein